MCMFVCYMFLCLHRLCVGLAKYLHVCVLCVLVCLRASKACACVSFICKNVMFVMKNVGTLGLRQRQSTQMMTALKVKLQHDL